MPPKEMFTLEKVVDAAFSILRKSGWPAVTARAIAKALKSSTMPVYSAMGSMEALEAALKRKALVRLAEYQARPYTENEFLNLGVGQVRFARDEPSLYRFLLLESPIPLSAHDQKELRGEVVRLLGRPFPVKTYFGGLQTGAFDAIALKGWIFTHGLAMGLMNGNLPPMDDARLIELLSDAGLAFFESEKKKNP
ncbi:MAG: TetR/AcrR family transcriptional regulator [Spirochaetes bacterium]|nr:TetR/AcrR family transcriptional regulator [Spirochaetota bacterium]